MDLSISHFGQYHLHVGVVNEKLTDRIGKSADGDQTTPRSQRQMRLLLAGLGLQGVHSHACIYVSESHRDDKNHVEINKHVCACTHNNNRI